MHDRLCLSARHSPACQGPCMIVSREFATFSGIRTASIAVTSFTITGSSISVASDWYRYSLENTLVRVASRILAITCRPITTDTISV